MANQSSTPNPYAKGATLNCRCDRRHPRQLFWTAAGRAIRTPEGLFRPLPLLAAGLPILVSHVEPLRLVVSAGRRNRRTMHGFFLRLAAALFARAVSDARPRDRARIELQLRPHLRHVRGAWNRPLDAIVRQELSPRVCDDQLRVCCRHGADLVLPGDERQAAAGVAFSYGQTHRYPLVRCICEHAVFQIPRAAKFGGREVTDAIVFDVTAEVETRDGRRGRGFGSMTMGNIWAWPSRSIAAEQTLAAMIELGPSLGSDCRRLSRHRPSAGDRA